MDETGVLVLEEAIGGVDSATEQAIQAAIAALMRPRATRAPPPSGGALSPRIAPATLRAGYSRSD